MPTASVEHRNNDAYCVIRFSGQMGLEPTHVANGEKLEAHGKPVNEATRLLIEALMSTTGVTEVRVVAAIGEPASCNVTVGWRSVTSSRSDAIATRVAVSQTAWNTVTQFFPEIVLKRAFWERIQY